jgi:hypothetical protein
LDLFSYGKWRGPGAGIVDCDWLISEGEMSMRGGFWFPRGGATEGCSSAAVCCGGRLLESSGVWIDPRWKTTSWAQRLFGPDTVVEIKQAVKIEWAGKERFLGRKKIVKKNLSGCGLNKKTNF